MRHLALITICSFLALRLLAAAARNGVDLPTTIGGVPFSFVYGGQPSKELIGKWKRAETTHTLSGGQHQRMIKYTDPGTRLEVTSEITLFPERNAVEWLLRLQNNGSRETPIIQDIRPMDLQIPTAPNTPITIYHVLGSALRPVEPAKRPKAAAFPCPECADAGSGEGLVRDYMPLEKRLLPSDSIQFTHYVFKDGKHIESYLPFFNMQWRNGGIIGAIGWTGQWMLRAQRSQKEVQLAAGQEFTHFKLQPGERIRTPRMLLIGWSGTDRMIGQNELRRILVTYYLPRIDGDLAMPPVAHTGAYALIFDDIARKTGKNPLDVLPTLRQTDLGGSKGRFADPGAALNYVTEKNQLAAIEGMPKVGIEAYWLDAGWFEGLWPGGRGSWVPNKNFPHGLRPLSDAAHSRGMKFLLWFDPEGVAPGSVIAREHPEWVLHQPAEGSWGGIFRFSEPAALKWITDLLCERIREWGIDIYRNDRNTNPLPFWRAADSPDRQGITEIRQIEGLYALWDALRERFPKLEIDNANWRITGPDLEMMKRSIGSLTRSELTNGGIPNSTADQAETAELSQWIPLSANILNAVSTYDFRSTATTGVAIGLDLQSPYIPVQDLQKAIAEVKELRPYWLGDFYPLTPVNQDETAWLGWQFHRADMNAGYAMLFRRSKASEANKEVSLHGLDPHAQYEVTLAETHDPGPKQFFSGEQLSRLPVSTSSPRSSVLIRYRKKQ